MPRNWWGSCFSLTFTWNRCRCFEWFLASPAEKEIPKHHHVYNLCNRLLSKWPRFLRQHTKQLHLSVERQHVNQCKLGSVPLASASPDNPTQTCIWDHMSMFGEARRVTTTIGYCAERFWYVASSLQPALQSVEIWPFHVFYPSMCGSRRSWSAIGEVINNKSNKCYHATCYSTPALR